MNSTSWQSVKKPGSTCKNSPYVLGRQLHCCLRWPLAVGMTQRLLKTPPPNIVIVMTDDQGWAQLGVHGKQGPAHAES